MDRHRAGRFVARFAFPAIIAVIVVVVIIFWPQLSAVFSSSDRFRAWIAGFGPFGPLMFVGVQAFQVIVFIVPGEVAQIAAGYLFGVIPGIVYSVCGIAVGSAFNFYVARLTGIQFVEGLFKKEHVDRFEALISSRRARVGFFLLFLIPGIPKDILCYVAGLSRMTFPSFLLISMVGRSPGIAASAVIGSSAAQNRWFVTAAVTGAALVLFVLGMIFRSRIERIAERISGNLRAEESGRTDSGDQSRGTGQSGGTRQSDGMKGKR